jgi:ABC-type uncharacterized transport system fused permease/ATPase subunit
VNLSYVSVVTSIDRLVVAVILILAVSSWWSGHRADRLVMRMESHDAQFAQALVSVQEKAAVAAQAAAEAGRNVAVAIADLIRLIGVPAVIVHPRSHTLSQLVSSEARWTQGK